MNDLSRYIVLGVYTTELVSVYEGTASSNSIIEHLRKKKSLPVETTSVKVSNCYDSFTVYNVTSIPEYLLEDIVTNMQAIITRLSLLNNM